MQSMPNDKKFLRLSHCDSVQSEFEGDELSAVNTIPQSAVKENHLVIKSKSNEHQTGQIEKQENLLNKEYNQMKMHFGMLNFESRR